MGIAKASEGLMRARDRDERFTESSAYVDKLKPWFCLLFFLDCQSVISLRRTKRVISALIGSSSSPPKELVPQIDPRNGSHMSMIYKWLWHAQLLLQYGVCDSCSHFASLSAGSASRFIASSISFTFLRSSLSSCKITALSVMTVLPT